MRRLRRSALSLIATLVLGSATWAYADSSQAPVSGSAAGGLSGYAISHVSYHPDAGDPLRVSVVTLRLSPTEAAHVSVRLSEQGSWHACQNDGGLARCPITPSVPMAALASLSVSASQ